MRAAEAYGDDLRAGGNQRKTTSVRYLGRCESRSPMMRYAAMATSMDTERLSLLLRDEGDAVWNHELLGEHEGGTNQSRQDVRLRLAEQRIQARSSGIGLLTIRRRSDDEPLGYCGLIVGRCIL
jgi:hypothetical protein